MKHFVDTRRSIFKNTLAGACVVAALTTGFGGWAVTTELSGAIIAPGSLVVDANVKKVQHPTGGIIGELRVQNGDVVRAGDVVARLDETLTRASLAVVSKTLDELEVRKARLESERDGRNTLTFSDLLIARSDSLEVMQLMQGERNLFDLRRKARTGQKDQLRKRVLQLGNEVDGLNAQLRSKSAESVLIGRELEGVRDLWKKNLIQINRLTSLEREATRLDGERAQIISALAQTAGKTAEVELQIIQIDQDLASDVARELRDVNAKMNEYAERKIAADDQLKRVELRAPLDGVVHDLAVHTIGGVISAGEVVMLIVPKADRLSVEAKVRPQDVDQVHVGQSTLLRLPAFDQRTTPEISGVVSRLSPDVTAEGRSGQSYYTVRIALVTDDKKLGDLSLRPGMPVEVFLKTRDRSVASYLTKPLHDHFTRAFRER